MHANERTRRGGGRAGRERRDTDTGELRRLIEPVVLDEGLELLELVYAGGRANALLRIVLDRPDGPVTVGDCSRVSGAVGRFLDGLDIIPKRYHLEVSSPGVDRALSRERDFLRFRGSPVKVSLGDPLPDDPEDRLGGRRNFSGQLAGYDTETGTLLLETEEGPVQIPRSRIRRARLAPDFRLPAKPGKGHKSTNSHPRRRARP